MIQVLDQNTINQIAAGEVIERPAAVVKELVENALDSGANAVTVEVKEGGISFIRVTDNGCGIEKSQLPTAFLPHATSKIKKAEDLLSVSSLGFRGEALSSIAAVCQVECITKVKSDVTGCRYEIHGGKEISKDEIGCPEGTTFIVHNLFYNIPARKKFLKSKMTESGYISEKMEQFILSHPEVSFKYIVDNKVKLQSSGNGDTKTNIYHIFGNDITKEIISISPVEGEMNLQGYLGKPVISRGTKGYMNYYINGRYIKSPVIERAIEEAYKNYSMMHRYPFTVLFLTIDSDKIDVNVHPTKMEIRFTEQEEVYQFFFNTISDELRNATMIPTVQLDEKVIPKPMQPKPVINPEPFETVRRQEIPVVKEEPKYEYVQQDIFKELPAKEEPEISFRVVGQVFSTYWLIEYKEELLIIDQHAAHEKVLYETLMEKLRKAEIFTQNLVAPMIVTLSPAEEEAQKKYHDTIKRLGFVVEPFGGKDYAISGVPSDFLGFSSKDYYIDLLDQLMEQGNIDGAMVLEKTASMACKAAVKGNQELSYHEATQLIQQMLALDNPYHCPHGRPTTISMSRKELEKKFKRIV